MTTPVHLWEVEPGRQMEWLPYPVESFSSWAEFLDEYGPADVDYNHVVQWEWVKPFRGTGGSGYPELHMVMFKQRRGHLAFIHVVVRKKDEASIREYLAKHWRLICINWATFAPEVADEQA